MSSSSSTYNALVKSIKYEIFAVSVNNPHIKQPIFDYKTKQPILFDSIDDAIKYASTNFGIHGNWSSIRNGIHRNDDFPLYHIYTIINL